MPIKGFANQPQYDDRHPRSYTTNRGTTFWQSHSRHSLGGKAKPNPVPASKAAIDHADGELPPGAAACQLFQHHTDARGVGTWRGGSVAARTDSSVAFSQATNNPVPRHSQTSRASN
jgi:hypothetical protein